MPPSPAVPSRVPRHWWWSAVVAVVLFAVLGISVLTNDPDTAEVQLGPDSFLGPESDDDADSFFDEGDRFGPPGTTPGAGAPDAELPPTRPPSTTTPSGS